MIESPCLEDCWTNNLNQACLRQIILRQGMTCFDTLMFRKDCKYISDLRLCLLAWCLVSLSAAVVHLVYKRGWKGVEQYNSITYIFWEHFCYLFRILYEPVYSWRQILEETAEALPSSDLELRQAAEWIFDRAVGRLRIPCRPEFEHLLNVEKPEIVRQIANVLHLVHNEKLEVRALSYGQGYLAPFLWNRVFAWNSSTGNSKLFLCVSQGI